jgi:hypothetical protein
MVATLAEISGLLRESHALTNSVHGSANAGTRVVTPRDGGQPRLKFQRLFACERGEAKALRYRLLG